MKKKKKPTTLAPDQARAVTDLRCAARKLAALFRAEGFDKEADEMDRAEGTAWFVVAKIEIRRNADRDRALRATQRKTAEAQR